MERSIGRYARLAGLGLALAFLATGPARGQDQGVGPKVWAVVAGVEAYTPPIPRRDGTAADVAKLTDWVATTAGWEREHVLVLGESGNAGPGNLKSQPRGLKPTRANLDYAFDRWLAERVGPKDVVLFAFAGRSVVRGDGEVLLLPGDARADDPQAGWLPDRAIERLLRDRECLAVLSWIDAPILGQEARAGRESSMLNRLSRWPGSSVWQATAEPGPGVDARSKGTRFAAALRRALGDSPRPVFASLEALNADPDLADLRFRQRGGLPAGLNLFRESIRQPEAARPGLLLQKGHAKGITALAIRPDGRTMVSAGEDSTIRVWAIENGQDRALLRVIPDALNGVRAMSLSPGGRFLAAGDGIGSLRVWDLDNPRGEPIPLTSPRPNSRAVASIAFLPPAEKGPDRFVLVDDDGHAETWTILKGGQGRLSIDRSRDFDEAKHSATRLAVASKPGGPASFAMVLADGSVRAFDRQGGPVGSPVVAEGDDPASARIAVDAEGRRLAVGDGSGRLRVVEVATGREVFRRDDVGGRVLALGFGPGGLLAVGAEKGAFLASADAPESGQVRALEGVAQAVDAVAFSGDGRWLAVRASSGRDLAVWKLDPGQPPSRRVLDRPGRSPSPVGCLAFGPSSASPMLAAGENGGRVLRWDLDGPMPGPRAVLPPHPGRVRHLATDSSGRNLLQVTEEGSARLWDLEQGREVRTLEGRWLAGAYLRDGRLVLIPDPEEGRGLVVVDPKTGEAVAGPSFADPDPLAPAIAYYVHVAVSRDGRRVAAIRKAEATAHLWDLDTGRARAIGLNPDEPGRKNPGPEVAAIDFSADGRKLLVAGNNGRLSIRDLDEANEARRPIPPFSSPNLVEVTAARLRPDGSGRVVAAGWNGLEKGQVFYWDGRLDKAGQPQAPWPLGDFSRKVLALTFLANGRYVAAAGDDRKIRVWDLDNTQPNGQPEEVRPQPNPLPAGFHHDEAVTSLLAWPRADGAILVSGSQDTTVRFWTIVPGPGDSTRFELRGTLAAAAGVTPARSRKPRTAGFQADAPWVAYTPEGVYDGSLDGERLVSFADGQALWPVDQFAPRLFQPRLTDKIRRGLTVKAEPARPAPPLLIEAPQDPGPDLAEVEIKVSVTDPRVGREQLRLYQNDAPVKDGERDGQFRPGAVAGEYLATVHLDHGDNRFHAMASRPDGPDARSPDLILYHSPPGNPGRMHVVALGVGDYKGNGLRFPGVDADQLSAYIQAHGVGAGPRPGGVKKLLRDEEVTRKNVELAFSEVRKAVEGHPEDTVVVFLAGHTDILSDGKGDTRYSLLLDKFPFPADAPALVAVRGPRLDGAGRMPQRDAFLPYATIYRNLMGLDALHRLVIVDACQADAILTDPGVQLVQQQVAMDRDARQSRTDYFLAARRGEPANEAASLKHGLLTYVLLRGMGATDLEPAPEDITALRLDADADRDGKVTTGELRRYVAMTLPDLSKRLAGVARGPNDPIPPAIARPAVEPRLQGLGASFPLIQLPRAKP